MSFTRNGSKMKRRSWSAPVSFFSAFTMLVPRNPPAASILLAFKTSFGHYVAHLCRAHITSSFSNEIYCKQGRTTPSVIFSQPNGTKYLPSHHLKKLRSKTQSLFPSPLLIPHRILALTFDSSSPTTLRKQWNELRLFQLSEITRYKCDLASRLLLVDIG